MKPRPSGSGLLHIHMSTEGRSFMTVQFKENPQRRRILTGFMSGAILVATGCASTTRAGRSVEKPEAKGEAEVSPGEDLMREHGVLERILLIYEETVRRAEGKDEVHFDVLAKSADVIRRFIENYHERLEEQFLFPRFEAAKREIELVRTLRAQHTRGRELTDEVIRLAKKAAADDANRAKLLDVLRAFSRMYRPHAAREDTVLFPVFRELLGSAAYMELGEAFEEREHEEFGEHGLSDIVREVATFEQVLGIFALDQFTTV